MKMFKVSNRLDSLMALKAFFVVILALPSIVSAEMWKCTPKDTKIPVFTETPSFGDDVECEQITGSKYSKPGGGGGEESKQRANKNNRNSPEQLRMRADAQKRKKDEAIRTALQKRKK